MRRLWVILAGVLAAAVGVVGVIDSSGEVRWVGGYDLTVHVESLGCPIRAVSAEAVPRRESADPAVVYLRLNAGDWAVTVDPFDGQPFTVPVRTSGRRSGWLERELSRAQFRCLVVVVTFDDGRRAAKSVDIPDVRVSREVRITFN